MATEFRRTRRGVEIQLSRPETDAVVQLLSDVRQLLQDEAPTPNAVPDWAAELGLTDLEPLEGAGPTPPADPALARLLPAGASDDEAAKDFRRLTERGLRTSKLAAIETSLAVLGRGSEQRTIFDDQQAQAFSRALTDVRLVMAQRLGIETEDDADAVHDWLARHGDDEEEPQPGESQQEWEFRMRAHWLAQLYDFLTWMQESLSAVLLAGLPSDGDGRRQPPTLSDDE